MTRAEAIALITSRLMRNDTDLNTLILSELDLQQAQLENLAEPFWFLLSEDLTYTLTTTEKRVPVPAGFLMESEYGALFYVDSNGNNQEIVKDDFDELEKAYAGVTGTTPERYALVGNYFIVYPLVTQSRVIKIKCYTRDVPVSSLASSATNDWLTQTPELLVSAAGRQVARYARDAEASKLFGEDFSGALALAMQKNTARREVNLSRTMGED